jgi:hypothetical protein
VNANDGAIIGLADDKADDELAWVPVKVSRVAFEKLRQ